MMRLPTGNSTIEQVHPEKQVAQTKVTTVSVSRPDRPDRPEHREDEGVSRRGKVWKHHILLLDPRVQDEVLAVRYVGRTNNDPDKRLEVHIESARVGGTSRKDRWIRELLKAGLTPKLKELGPGDERERTRLMKQFRAAGCRLVNMR